ncbi:hypothetical protein SAMD00019534_011770 [Acytostelium subglobosum LB1]|uniref:hypothetical protein n=1 Tax=Acytostelium subglobosum LB1 TaxID=1410327 RepID=UPI0006452242|nr:hypothetical protein SAMD00019534_011770 [Acytostelium subglobosum LB1]GAM18002.1 hypothetical protein SAMD00019534_011770 [Acytostelium subglobosum LB1]|eukprot:XP_012758598.1 hypothetical protein SAMD00019534_011770 [Acytostelium subglobosum LB1]
MDDGNNSGAAQLEYLLQSKLKRTQMSLLKIAEAVEREHSLSTSLLHLLKSSKEIKPSDFEAILRDHNERLTTQNQHLQSSYDRLLLQCKQLTDQLTTLTEQSGTHSTAIGELRLELEKTNDELILERKKIIKMNDDIPKIAVRLSSPALTSSSSSGAMTTTTTTTSTTMTTTTTTTTSTTNGMPSTPKSLQGLSGDPAAAELQVETSEEYLELKKKSEQRLNEARKLREEKANLMKEIQQLQIDIRSLPEERIITSAPYHHLRNRVQEVDQDLDIKSTSYNKAQQDLQQLNLARRTEREQIEASEMGRRQNLDRRITNLESEIAELKSEKEKLNSIIDQRLPNIPSQEYLAESKILLDTKELDIHKLKKEVDRLTHSIDSYRNSKDTITQMQRAAKSELELKDTELNEHREKLAAISKMHDELKQSETGMLERQNQLQLAVDLLKESRDPVDIEQLRSSVAKKQEELSEWKNKLKTIEELKTKHHQDITKVVDNKKVQLSSLHIVLSQSKGIQEKQKQELDSTMVEIDAIGKSYEQMQEQNTRLSTQISDKEDTHAQLMAENIKSQQAIRLTKEAQAAVEERVLRSEEKLKAQAEMMAKVEEKYQTLYKQLSKANEDLFACSFELEKNKQIVHEKLSHAKELKTQWDHLGAMGDELKKKSDDSIAALEREIEKAKKLDEEKQMLKKKLEKITVNNSLSSSTAEEELRLINQRLRCTICNDRQKNYVIAKCFHVFCKECIYSNIDTRKRRCPGCKRPFSESDVHQVYLT